MNENQIDYWLRWFDEKGIFDVNFSGPGYYDLVKDFANLGLHDPLHLLITIGRCIDD